MTAYEFNWNWQLASGPEYLWPMLADTGALCRDLGEPAIRVDERRLPNRPDGLRIAHEGVSNYEVWEEEPCEWEYPYQFTRRRNYLNGPWRSMSRQVELVPKAGGTRVYVRTRLKPRSRLLAMAAALHHATLGKRRWQGVLRTYDRLALSGRLPYQERKPRSTVRGGEERLEEARRKVIEMTGNTQVTEYLADFLRRAHKTELHRISPYKLADLWGTGRRETLRVFLASAHAGILNLAWEVTCPACHSVQDRCRTLPDVREPLYCRRCREKFSVHLTRTLRLRFRAHPLVRKSDPALYCATGPRSRPRTAVRQVMEAGETRYLKTRLPAGAYTISAGRAEGSATLEVSEEGHDTVRVLLTPRGFDGEEIPLSTEPNLVLDNKTPFRQSIAIEAKAWDDREVCASEAISLQIFRELFKREVIGQGERLEAENLTFMFTDLRDSAALYRNQGDRRAVGRLIEHFAILQKTVDRAGGAVVKTIGDSVMAVFNRPASAMKAFMEAQRLTRGRTGSDFRLKAGIHRGDCVAAGVNDRIDYFGNTVNLASRLVDYAGENEAVLSAAVASDPLVRKLLDRRAPQFRVEEDTPAIRGYEGEALPVTRVAMETATGQERPFEEESKSLMPSVGRSRQGLRCTSLLPAVLKSGSPNRSLRLRQSDGRGSRYGHARAHPQLSLHPFLPPPGLRLECYPPFRHLVQ
ncbi:MAG: adenylate/guanylate cyclase domain-containing protein [Balneolaceae bacterium]|nr:adenylate/guanylate cyclase domain-containing protein [Balneolaceae bacterium]